MHFSAQIRRFWPFASGPGAQQTQSGHESKKLDWIEVGRGLAALGVVLTHYTPSPQYFRFLGAWSVEFFFVLSGFIIFYVHRSDLGRTGAVKPYLWRRFVRVFPTYWIILTGAVFMRPFAPTLRGHPIGLLELLDNIFLAPGRNFLVGQAWTLRHEILFYGVFALAIANARVGLAIFFSWMFFIVGNIALNGLPAGMVTDAAGILLHHYNLDFAIGISIAIAALAGREKLALWCYGGLSLVAIFASVYFWSTPLMQVLLTKPIFATLLIVAIIASRMGIFAPRALVALGAGSYALYLSHEIVGSASNVLFRHAALDPWVIFGARVVVAVAFALMFRRWVEEPLLSWLNGLAEDLGGDRAARRVS
jgi:peptidoglycan/LPS O-acetylase OafA/YrhL